MHGCDRCPLRGVMEAGEAVGSTVPAECGGMALIGEGPGAEEVLAGRAFVGPSGQLLREELARAGHDMRRCFVGNVTRCRFPYGWGEVERLKVSRLCVANVVEELVAWKPRVVVALGKVAGVALGLTKWGRRLGFIHRLTWSDNGLSCR